MISETDRPAINALPKPLRALLLSADYTANGLRPRILRHEAGHECGPWPGLSYCPINDITTGAWGRLEIFADCLRYFLIGGQIPAGCTADELAPLCTWCEDRPAAEDHPDETVVERVCGTCYERLAQSLLERRLAAEAERREYHEGARVDAFIDEMKDRRAERERGE